MNQNKALEIAYKAHIGQLDKGGSPYILHPVRVALHCQTEDEKIVALLHDVVEDTSITFEDLKAEGVDDRLLEALKCLTKEEGEDYKAFIERVSTNRLATKVKIQDLKDNMDVTRLNGKAHWKLETYKEALEYLERCSNKKVLYVDMDNVLVNFQSGIDALDEDLKSRYAGCYDEVPNIFAKMQPNEAVKAARGISIIVPTLKSILSPTSSNNFLASERITFSCSLNSYKIPVNGTMISG